MNNEDTLIHLGIMMMILMMMMMMIAFCPLSEIKKVEFNLRVHLVLEFCQLQLH